MTLRRAGQHAPAGADVRCAADVRGRALRDRGGLVRSARGLRADVGDVAARHLPPGEPWPAGGHRRHRPDRFRAARRWADVDARARDRKAATTSGSRCGCGTSASRARRRRSPRSSSTIRRRRSLPRRTSSRSIATRAATASCSACASSSTAAPANLGADYKRFLGKKLEVTVVGHRHDEGAPRRRRRRSRSPTSSSAPTARRPPATDLPPYPTRSGVVWPACASAFASASAGLLLFPRASGTAPRDVCDVGLQSQLSSY